jgi:hypothetical protein
VNGKEGGRKGQRRGGEMENVQRKVGWRGKGKAMWMRMMGIGIGMGMGIGMGSGIGMGTGIEMGLGIGMGIEDRDGVGDRDGDGDRDGVGDGDGDRDGVGDRDGDGDRDGVGDGDGNKDGNEVLTNFCTTVHIYTRGKSQIRYIPCMCVCHDQKSTLEKSNNKKHIKTNNSRGLHE